LVSVGPKNLRKLFGGGSAHLGGNPIDRSPAHRLLRKDWRRRTAGDGQILAGEASFGSHGSRRSRAEYQSAANCHASRPPPIALQDGTISARLWAPPATLSVDTPSATAIDLGCAFTVQVDETGSGLLRVTSGWVAFQLDDRQAIVPAGAAALTRPGVGPGTPFFEDSSRAFRAALERLDFGEGGYTDSSALEVVLSEARPKDALSLLSLFRRLPPSARGILFDRAAQLVSPPAGLTREDAIARTNQPGMDAWWKKLGLGNAKNWWWIGAMSFAKFLIDQCNSSCGGRPIVAAAAFQAAPTWTRLIMKSPTELGVDLSRVVIVESSERQAVVE